MLDRFILGAFLAAMVVLAALRVYALTRGGAISAWIIGTLIFGVDGWRWCAALLAFFVSSSLLSRWRRQVKHTLQFEKTGNRDAAQVWANGGIAALFAVVPLATHVPSPRAHVVFLAALAAANADTWATEVGAAMPGTPYSLRTGRKVPIGTSGAVSIAGTAAALCGSLLLGLFAGPEWLAVTCSGVVASLCDSVLGAVAQAQWRDPDDPSCLTERPPSPAANKRPDSGFAWMGNDLVNFLATILSVLVCALLLLLPTY